MGIENKSGHNYKKILKTIINNKGIKIISVVLTIILCIGIYFGTYFYTKYGDFVGDVLGIANRVKKDEIIVDKPISVLLLGLDSGDTAQGQNENLKRSDTMILMNYDPIKQQCKLVSIPRDTYFSYKNSDYKINTAYQLGGEELVKTVVGDILDTKVHSVVTLDYAGFRGIINAIGGIDMYIEQDMYYDDDEQNLHIRFNKGETVHLDGKKAEEFFRWRKNNDGTGLAMGDLDRINNQQKLINKVIEKLKSPSIILDIDKIAGIIKDYFHVDLDLETIVSYAMSFVKMDMANIDMSTLPGSPQYIDDVSYFIADNEKSKDVISKDIISKENSNIIEVSRDNLKIKIYNCTKINGLASKVEQVLEDRGYSKIDIASGQEREKSEINIKDHSKKTLISKDIDVENIRLGISEKVDPDSYYDIVIFLGKDYKKIGDTQ